MNRNLIDFIVNLTRSDKKTLSQKALKATEEVGELAKAVLPFESAFATTHRFVDKEKILEEVADTILCALSVGFDLNYEFSDIEDMMKRKSLKWAELQSRESKAKWPVPFEIHVTVKEARLEDFKVACHKLNVKPVLLDLQRDGSTVFNDLMTSSVHFGTNSSVYTELKRISDGLKTEEFEVVREKIEAAPWHPAAPSRYHERAKMPPNSYFECHFGIKLDEERISYLRTVCEKHALHLSKNILKRDTGLVKIMATYRSYNTTSEDFIEDVTEIKDALSYEFQLDKPIIEFSLYDSKISHDASWLKND